MHLFEAKSPKDPKISVGTIQENWDPSGRPSISPAGLKCAFVSKNNSQVRFVRPRSSDNCVAESREAQFRCHTGCLPWLNTPNLRSANALVQSLTSASKRRISFVPYSCN